VKIAFAGKGGSGKTTLSSLFVRHIAAQGLPVVAIDADINQHLAEALGVDREPPAMGAHLTEIKEYLRGSNPRISSAAAMVKTTPPGPGSRLLRLGGPDPVHDLAVDTPCGARLLATGPFTDSDLGVACYHSKTGAVELYLNHLADGPGEYVVVDCTAGADSFASGLFTRFDLTVLVAEPTRKGISVYLCRSNTRLGGSPALFAVMMGAVVVGLRGAAQDRLHVDVPGAWPGRPGVPLRPGQGCRAARTSA
jgi:CO dehydrogenase maturation factor